jgi:hypothetical protein
MIMRASEVSCLRYYSLLISWAESCSLLNRMQRDIPKRQLWTDLHACSATAGPCCATMRFASNVEIYHLFSAYAAVPRSVILPVAMLAESELLRGAEPPAE